MASASDVPNKYDCVISGVGYMLLETEQKQATFAFAPTFLERTNVSEAYGDDDQDFWLTMSQKDWSLGEGQRYFTVKDEDARRRYWASNGVRVDREGRLSLLKSRYSVTLAGTPTTNIVRYALGTVAFAGSSNAFTSDTSSQSDLGAHGATSPTAVLWDRTLLYVSGASGALRRWNGSAWADWSATPSEKLALLNNTIYGFSGSSAGILRRYSTAGVATTIYTWRSGDGTAVGDCYVMIPYGGDLALVIALEGQQELWIYDGVAPAKVAQFPHSVTVHDAAVVGGTLIFGCQETAPYGVSSALYYFANGSFGRLWRSPITNTAGGATAVTRVQSFASGLVFTDDGDESVKFYDPETGAISTLFTNPVAFSATVGGLGAQEGWLLTAGSSTTGRIYPHASTFETTGTLQTSMFDGDTTRSKRFKGVVVEFDAGSDGNGGSVDIAYRIGDPDGSYTTLQTGAVSGTEYAIGQVGASITIKLTINKGTSTTGPIVKRVYLRGAPSLESFRLTQYVLNLTGRDGKTPLALRDGTFEPSDGLALATSLTSAIQSTTAISITDEFGTYTAILDPAECQIVRVRPQEYVAIVQARQV